MRRNIAIHHRISIRILAVLLVLFLIAATVVSVINQNNIRRLYEESFTERVLLTNALMATIIDSEDVDFFVRLMTNRDKGFKRRQARYYSERLEYWQLQEAGATEEELRALEESMRAFHREMNELKTEEYWETVDVLKHLKEVSKSTYLYVMADTGVVSKEGETLYTFIFDADDVPLLYEEQPDIDGLGTGNTSQNTITHVYRSKQQMDHVVYYNDVYGELYYAYAPILDGSGDVIAVFGTDVSLEKMNSSIASSTLLFNLIIFGIFIVIILILYVYLRRSIVAPLRSLTNTAHELAKGNIYAPTLESALVQKSEIGMLAHAVDDMSTVYQSMMSNARRLFAAANVGKLTVRSDEANFKGDIANFIRQINDTLDAITLYLNSVPESIFIMNKEFELYFCNHTFNKCFGGVTAREIMALLFPPEDRQSGLSEDEYLAARVEEALGQENNNTPVWIGDCCFSVMLKEIDLDDTVENSILVIAINITDLMREKENAQAAAAAKSSFLSRMSHEMRTPMNAIIGMARIAENTQDVTKLKYCLETIDVSSRHLLGIINDVLDMAKIEAGKFELEHLPMNLEKMLMKVCNIVIDNVEKKGQAFHVVLSKNLDLNYMGDELRLSQVITNLLSNAVKFTPQAGTITLSVDKVGQSGNMNTLRVSVADTGIGLTEEQTTRLWSAFEQADGSVTRKYGGTGLGLAISKSIVEKMGGRIWVESQHGVGSAFCFEVCLERASHQDSIIFDGIRPQDIRLLVVEGDNDVRKRFLDIIHNFGMRADAAKTPEEALELAENAHKTKRIYDIIFLDYNMPGANGFDMIRQLNGRIDKNTVIIITTFLEWHQIEADAAENNITRYITKPLFPSSILDAINDIVGNKLKTLDITAGQTQNAPDFSGAHIILAEDVEINREIVLALLEPTKLTIDCAENGAQAVDMFVASPGKYSMIFMDVQMPEMDGYTATRTIRASGVERAEEIPIVAMTANVFREDIENCLAAGMNGHIGKPVDQDDLLAILEKYIRQSG